MTNCPPSRLAIESVCHSSCTKVSRGGNQTAGWHLPRGPLRAIVMACLSPWGCGAAGRLHAAAVVALAAVALASPEGRAETWQDCLRLDAPTPPLRLQARVPAASGVDDRHS